MCLGNVWWSSNKPPPLIRMDEVVRKKTDSLFGNPRRWPRAIPIPRGNARYRPIPKGLRPPAQGCEARATLGHGSQMETNPNGVVTKTIRLASRRICRNPVGAVPVLPCSPKVGACAPTLGWWPQFLWDCSRPNAIRFHHTPTRSRHPRIPAGFRPCACEGEGKERWKSASVR